MSEVMIMITDKGFYPIESSGTVALAEEAREHGEINLHIKRIDDIDGNLLWERTVQ